MIIISGPSTVGKNPFIYRACNLYNLQYITPYTTRTMREEEINGRDYFFLSKAEFQLKIQSRKMSEWDYSLDNYYGYMFEFPGSGNQITHGLSRMALRIKARYPKEITTVFLMPSSRDMIYRNLKQMYSGNTLLLRMMLVEEEICHSALFDKIFHVTDSIVDLFQEKEMRELLLTNSNSKTIFRDIDRPAG